MLELTDTNNIAYLFLSAANRWLEVRTVRSFHDFEMETKQKKGADAKRETVVKISLALRFSTNFTFPDIKIAQVCLCYR